MTRTRIQIEYTDTFGGELNYSWVKREAFLFPPGVKPTKRAMVREAKRAMGISGLRHYWHSPSGWGDDFQLRFYRCCTALTVVHDEVPE